MFDCDMYIIGYCPTIARYIHAPHQQTCMREDWFIVRAGIKVEHIICTKLNSPSNINYGPTQAMPANKNSAAAASYNQ